MRIRHHAAAVVLMCSLGGLGLAFGVMRAFSAIEADLRDLGPDSLALQNLSRLQSMVGQWLVSCDLVLAGGATYLEEGASTQADETVALMAELKTSRLVLDETSRLDAMVARVTSVRRWVNVGAYAAGPEASGVTAAALAHVDAESAELVTMLTALASTMRARSQAFVVDADDRRSRLRAATIAGSLFYVAAVFVVWVWTGHRLVRPLQALTDAARRVADGDLGVRVATASPDEVGELGRNFDRMIASLSASRAEVERHQRDLELAIAERTVELRCAIDEAQVLARDAQQASKAKSAFLANMSHELRTPLNAIIGYSELLAEGGSQSPVVDLQRITTAGRHLLAVISDILDLSKIEAGRMDAQKTEVDGAALVQSVLDATMGLAAGRRNTLTAVAPSPIGSLWTDATMLRQALLNLVGNACKFTEGGCIEVVTRRETLAGGAWIIFEVRDTGIGIARDDLGRLFNDFVQVDDSATRRYGGTGLGLSITRRLVELLGGTVTAESVLGEGSTFAVRLPVDRSDSTLDPQSGVPAAHALHETDVLVDVS